LLRLLILLHSSGVWLLLHSSGVWLLLLLLLGSCNHRNHAWLLLLLSGSFFFLFLLVFFLLVIVHLGRLLHSAASNTEASDGQREDESSQGSEDNDNRVSPNFLSLFTPA